MDITIHPQKLRGTVTAIPSKSQAHRLLICAAFADRPTYLVCPQTNQDIEATAACLNALGANITRTPEGYQVIPAAAIPESAELPCGESGSTLRFLLPVAAALGVDTLFHLEGRLPQRPLSPLWEEMERMGCRLSRPTENTVRCQGKLHGGAFSIRGDTSSQFITGLLFAACLLKEPSRIHIIGKLESAPYVDMTRRAIALFGVDTENLTLSGDTHLRSPGRLLVEGDWSNAAFFLAANTMGSEITVDNLDPDSPQGDRLIVDSLKALRENRPIDCAQIPDLGPILSVAAAAGQGGTLYNIGRLRLKESDRVAAIINMLSALGIQAKATESELTVFPGRFHGGTVDAMGDHRIAMAAAIAATAADGPVTILGAQCVRKSYPDFWSEYERLGGKL